MLTITLTGLDSNAFIYIDDIIVFGCPLQHHNESSLLRTSFYSLRNNEISK